MKQLRDYQEECVNTVFQKLQSGTSRQLVVLATGLGKTFTATKITERFSRTLWLTHTEELIDQSARALAAEIYGYDINHVIDEYGGVIPLLDKANKENTLEDFRQNIGVIKQKRFDLNAKIVVASIQTIYNRLEKIDSNMFDIVVIDEAHLSGAKSFAEVLNHFNPKLRLGLTATPNRTSGFSLADLFDEISFERDISFGIKNNYLCELDAIRVKTDISLDNVKTIAGDLSEKDLKVVNNPVRNNLIVDKYLEYATNRQAIVFAVDVEHCMELCAVFNRRGVDANFVVGNEELCPDRKQRISDFKNNKYRVLVNVNILTAGFDYPEVGCIIMARPTKSLTLYMQAIGRGTRLKSNFKECIILDIVDVSKKHSLVNTWNLDANKRLEDKIFMTTDKRNQLIELRDKKRASIDADRNVDEKANLMELPEMNIKDNWNMKQPATAKQIQWLAGLGYDTSEPITKGQAAQIIGSLPARKEQIDYIKKNGYNVENGATIWQVQTAITEIINRKKQHNRKTGIWI